MKSFIDWLAFTDKTKNKEQIITQILNYSINEIRLSKKGMLGYKRLELLNEIKILSEGGLEMGEHYILSGSALRLLEKNNNLVGVIKSVKLLDVSITRIDIAIDMENGKYFTFEQLKNDIIEGNVLSRWRTSKEIIERSLKNGETLGNTIYLGSRTSDVMLRFYRKDLQSENEIYKNIIRMELEVKRGNAENLVKKLESENIGNIIKGILNNYIRVIIPNKKDSNKSRWDTVKYWKDFIDDIEKIKLSDGIMEKNLNQKIEWFRRQNGPSMALIGAAEENLLQQILEDGYKRLKPKDLSILDTYLKAKK